MYMFSILIKKQNKNQKIHVSNQSWLYTHIRSKFFSDKNTSVMNNTHRRVLLPKLNNIKNSAQITLKKGRNISHVKPNHLDYTIYKNTQLLLPLFTGRFPNPKRQPSLKKDKTMRFNLPLLYKRLSPSLYHQPSMGHFHMDFRLNLPITLANDSQQVLYKKPLSPLHMQKEYTLIQISHAQFDRITTTNNPQTSLLPTTTAPQHSMRMHSPLYQHVLVKWSQPHYLLIETLLTISIYQLQIDTESTKYGTNYSLPQQQNPDLHALLAINYIHPHASTLLPDSHPSCIYPSITIPIRDIKIKTTTNNADHIIETTMTNQAFNDTNLTTFKIIREYFEELILLQNNKYVDSRHTTTNPYQRMTAGDGPSATIIFIQTRPYDLFRSKQRNYQMQMIPSHHQNLDQIATDELPSTCPSPDPTVQSLPLFFSQTLRLRLLYQSRPLRMLHPLHDHDESASPLTTYPPLLTQTRTTTHTHRHVMHNTMTTNHYSRAQSPKHTKRSPQYQNVSLQFHLRLGQWAHKGQSFQHTDQLDHFDSSFQEGYLSLTNAMPKKFMHTDQPQNYPLTLPLSQLSISVETLGPCTHQILTMTRYTLHTYVDQLPKTQFWDIRILIPKTSPEKKYHPQYTWYKFINNINITRSLSLYPMPPSKVASINYTPDKKYTLSDYPTDAKTKLYGGGKLPILYQQPKKRTSNILRPHDTLSILTTSQTSSTASPQIWQPIHDNTLQTSLHDIDKCTTQGTTWYPAESLPHRSCSHPLLQSITIHDLERIKTLCQHNPLTPILRSARSTEIHITVEDLQDLVSYDPQLEIPS